MKHPIDLPQISLRQVRAAAALALLLCLSGGLIKAFEINPKDPIPDCREPRERLRWGGWGWGSGYDGRISKNRNMLVI